MQDRPGIRTLVRQAEQLLQAGQRRQAQALLVAAADRLWEQVEQQPQQPSYRDGYQRLRMALASPDRARVQRSLAAVARLELPD